MNLPLTNDSERIITLDVLRGFALFGIFYAHMIFWYAGGPLPVETYQLYKDPGSGIAIGFYMIFIIGKFFSLFSFLFGLSFYLQIEKLANRHQSVITNFGWRLAITSPAGNALLCIAIFILQIFMCRWWLTHFNYGPIEWLWRSATDLQWRALIKKPVPPLQAD